MPRCCAMPRCAPTTARWSAQRGRSQAAQAGWTPRWQRRVEIELADAAGTLEASVAGGRALWPECAGLAHPAALVRRDAGATRLLRWRGARVHAASEVGRDAARALVAALALPSTTRSRASRRPASALFTDDGHAAQAARRSAVARRGRATCSAASASAVRQHEAHLEHRPHGAAVARAARRRTPRYKRAARPGRHGRPRALRARAAARRDAVGLGAGAAGRARAPRADRRVPGHQPAAMACAARLAVGLRRRRRRRQRAAPAGGVHRRRPEAEHLPLPPRRAARVRARPASSSSRAWAAACSNATTRGATRPRCWRPSTRCSSAAAAAGEFAGFRAHTTEVAPAGAPGLCAAARRVARPPAARATAAAAEPVLARQPDRAAPRARRAAARGGGARRGADAVQQLVRQRHCARRGHGAVPQARVAAAGGEALRALHVPHVAPEDVRARRIARGAGPARAARRAGLAAATRCRWRVRCAARCSVPSDDDLLTLSRRAARRRRLVAGADAGSTVRAPALAACAHAAGGAGSAARPQLPPHDLLDRIVHEGDLRGAAGGRGAGGARARRWSTPWMRCWRSALELDGGALRHALQLRARAAPARAPGRAPARARRGAAAHRARRQGPGGASGVRDGRRSRAAAAPRPPRCWSTGRCRPTRAAARGLRRQRDAGCPPSLRALLAEEHAARAARGTQRPVRGDDARRGAAGVQPHRAAAPPGAPRAGGPRASRWRAAWHRRPAGAVRAGRRGPVVVPPCRAGSSRGAERRAEAAPRPTPRRAPGPGRAPRARMGSAGPARRCRARGCAGRSAAAEPSASRARRPRRGAAATQCSRARTAAASSTAARCAGRATRCRSAVDGERAAHRPPGRCSTRPTAALVGARLQARSAAPQELERLPRAAGRLPSRRCRRCSRGDGARRLHHRRRRATRRRSDA